MVVLNDEWDVTPRYFDKWYSIIGQSVLLSAIVVVL